MKIERIIISPSIAETLLANNNSNRSLNKMLVKFYEKELKDGAWMLNGETIKIGKDGRLLDGQHRLTAIIKSGISMDTYIAKDVENDCFATIDTGRTRKASDVLSAIGVLNDKNISAGISKYLNLKRGLNTSEAGVGQGNKKISNTEVVEEYNNNADMYQRLFKRGAEFYKHNFRVLTPSNFIAFYRYFQTKYSDEQIDLFFDSISERSGVGGVLFNRLLNNNLAKRKMILSELNAIIIKAFNSFITGKKIIVLSYRLEEKFPTL